LSQPARPSPNPRATARAIDALRRGWPIQIDGMTLLPIETADATRLAEFDPDGEAPLLISSGRAATLKLANQIAAADPDAPVLIERAPWLDFAAATALADPQLDLATPLKGPFRTIAVPDRAVASAALRLARIAGMLPAFFIGTGEAEDRGTLADLDAPTREERNLLTHMTAGIRRAKIPHHVDKAQQVVAFQRKQPLVVAEREGRDRVGHDITEGTPLAAVLGEHR